MKKYWQKLTGKPGFNSLLASLIAIGIGLIAGLVLLLFFNAPNAMYGFGRIILAGISSPDKIAKVLYQAAPLVMTGLAVGFAFKTGLFNIGATGQYLMGSFFALFSAMILRFPWWAALLASLIGGALWGFWPGLFKALFNVNEVITSIMFNWIGLFLMNLLLANIPPMLNNYYGGPNAERTANLAAANPAAIIPRLGLDQLFGSSYMNIGIILAAVMALIIHIVINKTTFGYELKACGLNRSASIYAGINAKRNIVLSMTIAGSLAGFAGGLYYLSGNAQYTIEKILPAMGFNGIPVALLATSHPVGIIFSALFVSYIQVGGDAMQPEFVSEIIDIIIAVIIYLSAFALLFKGAIAKRLNRKNAARLEAVTKEAGQ